MITKTNERTLDFSGQRVFVGLDIHNKSWNASIYCEDIFVKSFTTNNAEAIHSYLAKTFPNAEYHTVYEAGYCGFAPYRELLSYGLNPIVVNPADVPTSDKEKQTKTDKVDSKKLARSLKNDELKAIYVPSIEKESIRDLVRQRQFCVKEQTQIKNSIKSFLQKTGVDFSKEFPNSRKWSNSFIEYLKNLKLPNVTMRIVMDNKLQLLENIKQEIKTLEQQINEIFNKENNIENFKLIKSVPGIDNTSGAVILSELIDINRFKTFNELASYCGLAPREHSSGESTKTGTLLKRRNSKINKTIIESSWIALRKDPALLVSYNRLLHKMKAQKAIIKIARKLLRKIMMVLKHREQYVTGLT
jgi:transposase